jgi:hypothetical protein
MPGNAHNSCSNKAKLCATAAAADDFDPRDPAKLDRGCRFTARLLDFLGGEEEELS